MRTNFKSSLPGVRRFWLGLAAVLCAAGMSSAARAQGTLANVDRDNGLPDAQLGASVRSFQGLQKTEDLGRFQTYKRPSDKMSYEGVEITGITYNFFKDRLYSIDLDVAGTGNVKKIFKLLEKKYGKDHTQDARTFSKTAAQLFIYEWAGTKAYCLLKAGSDMRGGVIVFVDRPTWDMLEVPRRERENEARQKLQGSYTNGDF